MLEPKVARVVAQIFEGGVGAGIAEDVEIEPLLNEARAGRIEIGGRWDAVGEVGVKVEGADKVVAEAARGEGEGGGGGSGRVEGESGEEKKEGEGGVVHLLRCGSSPTGRLLLTFTQKTVSEDALIEVPNF